MFVLKNDEITLFLRQVQIFSELEKRELEKLAAGSQLKKYPKGFTVSKRGEAARYLYIIYSGKTSEIVVDDHDLSCIARPNSRYDYFGELGLMLNEPYTTTSVATTPVELIRIPKDVFCEVAWSNPSVIRSMMKMLKLRLQKSGEKTISFINFNAKGRLSYNLLQMRDENNQVFITQESLSEHCGIVRQTVSAILNEWKQIGAIDIRRGQITIMDTGLMVDYFMSDQNIR